MLYEYESVFYPIGPDWMNDVWELKEICNSSTDKLFTMIEEYEKRLEIYRSKEPAKKRKNKTKYRIWVQRSQDYLEILRALHDEVEKRKDSSVVIQ